MTNIGAVLPSVYACAGARPGRTARPCWVLKASARRAGRSQGRLRSRARSESRMAVRLGTADGVERKHAPSTPSSACEHTYLGGGRPGEAAASGRVQSVDPSTEAHESVVVGCVMTLGVSRGHAAPAGAGADHFAVRRGVPSNPQTRRLGCGGEIFIRTRALPARACLPCSCVFQPRLRRECATGRVCRPRSSTARKARTRRLSASWWRTASSTTCSPAPRRT